MTLTITYKDGIVRTFNNIEEIGEWEAPNGTCLVLTPAHPRESEIRVDRQDIKKMEVEL